MSGTSNVSVRAARSDVPRDAAGEVEKATVISQAAALFALFVAAVGYAFVLPVLPFVIERLIVGADAATVARHTGFLTATYALSVFLLAPAWGLVSDRIGRRPVMTAGLAGLASSLVIFSIFEDIYLLYLGRFLDGLFASAIGPAALAFLSDQAPSDERRAQRSAWASIAALAGFLLGPWLGGAAAWVAEPAGEILTWLQVFSLPFVAAAGLAAVAAVAVHFGVPATSRRVVLPRTGGSPAARVGAAMPRLLAITFVVAAAVGSFEVALALVGKQFLAMTPFEIGVMFTACSLLMFVAQGVVFSPIVRRSWTGRFVTPTLVVLVVALLAASQFAAPSGLIVAMSVAAASAGVLAPILAFWTSLAAGGTEGHELGKRAIAGGIGQTLGSAGAGMLFAILAFPKAAFLVPALLVAVGVPLSLRLSRDLILDKADRGEDRDTRDRSRRAGFDAASIKAGSNTHGHV